jgi:hypothetical protein
MRLFSTVSPHALLFIFPIRRVDKLPHHIQRESQRRVFLASNFDLLFVAPAKALPAYPDACGSATTSRRSF